MAQKRRLLCGWFLSVSFLFAVSAWAQITARDGAYTLTSPSSTHSNSSDGLDLQSVPQGPQRPTGTNQVGFSYRKASDPTPSAVDEVTAHDNVSSQDSTSDVIKKKEVTEIGAGLNFAANSLPPTITVKTAALLELHAMRKSAVDLCIQLPTKYRTHLPECAEIFKHEIRLQGLAKDHH